MKGGLHPSLSPPPPPPPPPSFLPLLPPLDQASSLLSLAQLIPYYSPTPLPACPPTSPQVPALNPSAPLHSQWRYSSKGSGAKETSSAEPTTK